MEQALSIIGPILAAVSGLGLDHAWQGVEHSGWTVQGAALCVVWGVLLAIGIALPTIVARRNSIAQTWRVALHARKKLLHAIGEAFSGPRKMHVRASIMKCCGDHERQVEKQSAYNMDSDPDQDLAMHEHAGVSGHAFAQRKVALGDLTFQPAVGQPRWGLSDAQERKVRSGLKSILSAPIFDPKDPAGPLLGTLQVDSDVAADEVGFREKTSWHVIECFADVAALLMVKE